MVVLVPAAMASSARNQGSERRVVGAPLLPACLGGGADRGRGTVAAGSGAPVAGAAAGRVLPPNQPD